MDLATFNALEPQYRQQLKDLAKDVCSLVSGGLSSFLCVSEMLLGKDADVIEAGSNLDEEIKSIILVMNSQMKCAQEVASKECECIDRKTECLTADIHRFTNLKKQREGELYSAKEQLKTHQSSLEYYRQALETERRNLREAEAALEEMRRRKQSGEVMTGVGAGLLAIPIVGWIVGGTLLGVGIQEMNQAAEAASRAEEVVRNSEHQVASHQNKVSEFQTAIYNSERDIQRANENIKNSENQLQQVSQTRSSIAYVQEKIRCAVVQVGGLCSVSAVAELHTRYLIMVQPLMKVMEDMTTALGQISGGDLLHSKNILSLMNGIKDNFEKQKARQIKQRRDDEEGYY